MKSVKLILSIFALIIFSLPCYVVSATIDPHDRLILAQKLASGRSHVVMLVATRDNSEKSFYDFLKINNIVVRYAAEELGYYRLRVPIELVVDVAAHPAVEGVNLSNGEPWISLYERGNLGEVGPNEQPGVPPVNLRDYIKSGNSLAVLTGIGETGVIDLRNKHPTFDGRGVTIAIIESFPDFEAPELSSAITLDGKPVPKISEAYAIWSYDPEDSDRALMSHKDENAVLLAPPEFSFNKHLVIDGRNVRMPDEAFYQVSFLDEKYIASHGKDLNKDGNPSSKPRTFAVAKRQNEDCLLIDINQNDDLGDDPCIRDYNSDRRIHHFSTNDRGKKGASFILLKTEHPEIWVVGTPFVHTHLAHLAAAGNRFFGSDLSGPAPAARLVPIAAALSHPEALLEAFIHAARLPEVDVIHSEYVNEKRFNHGGTVTAIILSRIIKKYNKVITAAVGNSKVGHSISLEGSSANVIGVAQFHPGSTRDILRGGLGNKDAIPEWSSSGPTEDGQLKPDIIAPSLGVFPLSRGFSYARSQAYYNKKLCPNILSDETIACFSGTSMAGPVAAGAVAVLISAAKQLGIQYSAEDIYRAVTMSARHLPDVPIARQGNGVINIPKALEWLRNDMEGRRPQVAVSSSVNTVLGSFLTSPKVGRGLYEQMSWRPGIKVVRYIYIRRLSGESASVEYPIRIIGDEQSVFSVPESITLSLESDAVVPIEIAPGKPGHHSAILEIGGHNNKIARIALNVIAAVPITIDNNYVARISAEFGPYSKGLIYFYLPERVAVLSVSSDFSRQGFLIDSFPLTGAAARFEGAEDAGNKEIARDRQRSPLNTVTVYNPSAGIWQVVPMLWEAKPGENHEFAINVRAYTEEMLRNKLWAGDEGGELVKIKGERTYYRSVNGRLISGRIQFSPGDLPRIIDLDVSEPIEIDVKANIVGANGLSRVITIVAFKCREERCYMRGVGTGAGQSGLLVYKPTSGKWRIAVDVAASDDEEAVIDYEVFAAFRDGSEKCSLNKEIIQRGAIGKIDGGVSLANTAYDGCVIEAVSDDLKYRNYIMREVVNERNEKSTELIIDYERHIPLRRGIVVDNN